MRLPGRPRIVGVVVAKDEWPLLGLSITHALTHVDRVIVVDHGSTDGSVAGVHALAATHPGRIELVHAGGIPWWQAALTQSAVEHVGGRHDWVYVFDADEFLLIDARPLRRVLARVPRHVVALRYELHNWVAPFDADGLDPAALAGVRHRATPGNFLPPVPPLAARTIATGGMNWFDMEFGSKLIVRSDHLVDTVKGMHHLVVRRQEAVASDICAAHVPFLGRRRLDIRIEQGRALDAVYDDLEIGWQSRMIARLDETGELDDFWARHSVGGPDDGGARPIVIADDRLATAAAAAVQVVAALPAASAEVTRVAAVAATPGFAALVQANQARLVAR